MVYVRSFLLRFHFHVGLRFLWLRGHSPRARRHRRSSSRWAWAKRAQKLGFAWTAGSGTGRGRGTRTARQGARLTDNLERICVVDDASKSWVVMGTECWALPRTWGAMDESRGRWPAQRNRATRSTSTFREIGVDSRQCAEAAPRGARARCKCGPRLSMAIHDGD